MFRFLCGVFVGTALSSAALAIAFVLKPLDEKLEAGPIAEEVSPLANADSLSKGAELSLPPSLPVEAKRIDLPLPAEIARTAVAEPVQTDLHRLSIILKDDGRMKDASFALAALPFPVAVALDPTQEDALVRIAAFRANGIEVLSLGEVALPESSGNILLTQGEMTVVGATGSPVAAETVVGAAVGEELSRLVASKAQVAVLDLKPDVLAGMRIFNPANVAIVPVSQQLKP